MPKALSRHNRINDSPPTRQPMTSLFFSPVTLRVIGLCLFIAGTLVTPKLFFWHRALMTGQTGPTPLYLTGTATNRIMVVRDAVYSEENFTRAFVTTAAALFLGLLFLVFARPLARFVSRGTETRFPNEPSA